MAMDAGKEKIVSLAQEILDASDDRGAVGIANFVSNNSDGVGSFLAQSAGKEVGLIVEFADGSENAVPGVWGNVFGCRGVVDDGGNRSRGKPEVLGDGL